MAKTYYKFPNEILTADEANEAVNFYSVPNGYEFVHWSSSSSSDVEVTELNVGGSGVTITNNVTYYPVLKYQPLYKNFSTVTVNGQKGCKYYSRIDEGEDKGYYAFEDEIYDSYVEYWTEIPRELYTGGVIEFCIDIGAMLDWDNNAGYTVVKDFADFYIDVSEIPANGAMGYQEISYFGNEVYLKISNGGTMKNGTALPAGNYFFTCFVKKDNKILSLKDAYGDETFNIAARIYDKR